MFMINSKTYFCIVDYHSKFPVVKQTGGVSAVSLIKRCKIIFSEYGFLRKIMSDVGTNFASEKFCSRCLNIYQAKSSYSHRSSGQVEACVRIAKFSMKKCFYTNNYVYLALLQKKFNAYWSMTA